jgi:tRNA U54 and U55 pseudouridine synthase Pus10
MNDEIENNKNSLINIPEYDKLINLKFDKKCNFCYGIFNTNYFNEIILKIKTDLEEYEYKEIKLITNFCCLFDLFYWYLRKEIESKNIIKINPNLISTSTIRKCFKILFSPLSEKILNKKFASNSKEDLDIIIIFDFSNELYNQINKEIENCIKDNENNKEKYKININDDISKIKTIINEILNISLKEKLDNIFNLINISKYLIINYKLLPHQIYIKGNYIKLNREIGQTK